MEAASQYHAALLNISADMARDIKGSQDRSSKCAIPQVQQLFTTESMQAKRLAREKPDKWTHRPLHLAINVSFTLYYLHRLLFVVLQNCICAQFLCGSPCRFKKKSVRMN
jgi:hypothetical protein